jgi:hypothetical protein
VGDQVKRDTGGAGPPDLLELEERRPRVQTPAAQRGQQRHAPFHRFEPGLFGGSHDG